MWEPISLSAHLTYFFVNVLDIQAFAFDFGSIAGTEIPRPELPEPMRPYIA
jgi:hypothetical protein